MKVCLRKIEKILFPWVFSQKIQKIIATKYYFYEWCRGGKLYFEAQIYSKWPLMSLIGMWEWVECFKHETTHFDVIFFKFIVFTNFSSKPTLECKLLFVVLGSINLLFSFRPGIFKISEIIGQESTYPTHRRVFLVKNRPKCLKIKCLENK